MFGGTASSENFDLLLLMKTQRREQAVWIYILLEQRNKVFTEFGPRLTWVFQCQRDPHRGCTKVNTVAKQTASLKPQDLWFDQCLGLFETKRFPGLCVNSALTLEQKVVTRFLVIPAVGMSFKNYTPKWQRCKLHIQSKRLPRKVNDSIVSLNVYFSYYILL